MFSPLVDRYFVGRTTHLENVLERHNQGKNKHTKSGIPWNLVYREGFVRKRDAKEREQEIKSSANREQLIASIRSQRNELNR